MIFDKDIKAIQWRRDSLFNKPSDMTVQGKLENIVADKIVTYQKQVYMVEG